MSKTTPTKPTDDTDTGAGAGAGTSTPLASTINPSPTAIRAATTDSNTDADPAPSIPQLLERVSELESQLAALLDDLAVALPDLRAPSPIPTPTPAPSGAYALQPPSTALETLRDRAAAGDRRALLSYLRLRRS